MTATRKNLAVVALCCASAVCGVAVPQENGGDIARPETSAPAVDDEVIVRGQRVGELRLEIQLAEDAVFDRFNQINSDDRFDIVCRMEQVTGSLIDRRICASNDWREQDANHASAQLQQLRGETGPAPQQFLGAQQHGQQLLSEEVRRLVHEDESLYQAVERLARARMALAERTGQALELSAARSVIPDESGLPFGAKRMLQVHIGRDRWSHMLTEHTFAVAQISGKIRSLAIECEQGRDRFPYEDRQSWTLPPEWSACILLVDAKRDTEFVIFELE